MTGFRVSSTPGYNTEKSGQHATELNFILQGSEGAFVWHLATGISPVGPQPTREPTFTALYGANSLGPSNMGLFAHSELNDRTMHDTESPATDSCEFLQGRACVCDYQSFMAESFIQAFACEGFDGVERLLRQHYREHYGKDA